MKILIIGGNGFIGNHLTDNLQKRGHTIATFDKTTPKYKRKDVSYISGDVLDRDALEKNIKAFDGVYNLAGRLGSSETVDSPYESVDINIKGALNFYEAVKKFNKPAVQITMGAWSWPNTYSITKYAAERFAIMYNLYHGTKIAVVRSMNVYGPGQKQKPVRKVFPNFIIPALKNEPILIYGDGKQLIDTITAWDNAEIMARALLIKHKTYNRVFQAGTGKPITVINLANKIIKLAGSRSKIKHLPMRDGEPIHSVTTADFKTLAPLGFTKKDLTPLNEGLKKTIVWYKENLSQFS